MPLDAAHQQHIRDHLTRWHGGPLACTVCRQQDWARWQIELGRFIFLDARPLTPPDDLDLVLALVCGQCGQMVLLDLAMLPVADLPGAPEPPPA